jgi:hypothetical protein
MAAEPRRKADPEQHDFPAAQSYLSLLAAEAETAVLVTALRAAGTVRYKAKDLLRAGSLPLLATDDEHVRRDLEKVARGERLSPVLLVRGRLADRRPLTVADGYHRICAAYHLDEEADVPCRVVDLAGDASPAAGTEP